MPRKIAGTWHPKEGIPCKPPTEVTVICAAATAPRLRVILGGETLMSKSGDRVTEVQALINTLASTEPSPVTISYPEPVSYPRKPAPLPLAAQSGVCGF